METSGYKNLFYHLNSTENDKFPKTVFLTNLKRDMQELEAISEEC
jgi:hypothetical protein